MSDAEIADLRAQIQRQADGAEITSARMKTMEDELERLRKENKILRDGLEIVGPSARRPDPA